MLTMTELLYCSG